MVRAIHLYQGSFTECLKFDELTNYLRTLLPGIQIFTHEEFVRYYVFGNTGAIGDSLIEELALKFARAKVRDLQHNTTTLEPLPAEIVYERKRLQNIKEQSFGILYDGERLSAIYNDLLPESERGLHTLHIVFTNQLFGTWSKEDLRFHARVSLYGIPCIISTTGLIEAPAKPRQYYLSHQLGISREIFDTQPCNEYLVYDDTRITNVVKGYIVQALFYYVKGNPFCTDPGCRLYNAHWQKELLYAQLDSPYEFCREHQRVLDTLNKKTLL